MKKAIAPSLILAGLFAVGSAQAGPYDSWTQSISDDDRVQIEESFNTRSSYESTVTRSEDNDVSEDNDIAVSLTRTEDNDYTSSYRTSEDNDVSSWYAHSEDNDQDNDYTSVYTHTEDNDVSEDNDYTHTEDNDVATDIDVDFLVATPTLTSHKYQSQDAGHESSQTVLGSARGHEVGVAGGTTVVSAGNDEQNFFGPAMVNTNVNQLPQNNTFIQGSNSVPISQSNTFAGRDMGPKGVFAPIGNTAATVVGNVGQSSSAGTSQSGDSANSIADVMSAPISK